MTPPHTPGTLHATPKPDGFAHESPIRAFSDWDAGPHYAIGKGFRPALSHTRTYLDAMEEREGWQIVQVLEAATSAPSMLFRKPDRSAEVERAAIVALLRSITDCSAEGQLDLLNAADAIERGEHLNGGVK